MKKALVSLLHPLRRRSHPLIGKSLTVGRFTVRVEDVIGEGGYGIVFRVQDAHSDEKYALKRLLVNNDNDLDACKREIAIASSMKDCKNIAGVLDSNIKYTGDGVYEVLMLMQFYRGSLIKLMNERVNIGFSEVEVLQIFCDIVEAVSYLHFSRNPVIHMDLKVENILQGDNGDFVLCDFGSATTVVIDPKSCGVAEAEEQINKYTTISYRAPEMVNLHSLQQITTKADIWALGCLLYKLCFFSLPFGESALAIISGKLRIPESSTYSTGIHSLIRYMLEVDPEKRPDIFQVAFIVFRIAGKNCPVPNLNRSSIPNIGSLPSF